MEEVLDDIQQGIRCDRCHAKIKFKEDLREGFVYAGEEEKTHFLSNTQRYSVIKKPFPFTICKKCSQNYRNKNVGGLLGLLAVGGILMVLPFGWTSFTIGIAIVAITLMAAMEVNWSKEENIDDVSLRQFEKKYPEHYHGKKTRLFTRKSYKKMYEIPSLDIEKYMEDFKKRNEEILEHLENLSKKKGS